MNKVILMGRLTRDPEVLNQSYLVTADKPHIMLVFSILSGCTNIVLQVINDKSL